MAYQQESPRSLLTNDPRQARQSSYGYQQPPQQPIYHNQSYNNAGSSSPNHPDYHSGGYHYREGMASSGPSTRRGKLDFIGTKWPRLFFLVIGIQAIICLAFEAYVFGQFQSNLKAEFDYTNVDSGANSLSKTIPTFLAIFIFAFMYDIVLAWDALRSKNTIQIIGLCLANLAILVYAVLQTDQIASAVQELSRVGAIKVIPATQPDVWSIIRPFLIAIPIIIAVCTIALSFIAWKLYQVFAWDILKQIGADYRMKKRFLAYQIYIALLKFDFFFFLGFTVQFVVIVVTALGDTEQWLTIAAIPVTVAILLLAAFFTRREIKLGMIAIIALYLCALAYFFFKLVRIYQPGYRDHYRPVQRSLTAFAVLTILLILLTIVNAVVCMRNFGAGLKDHLLAKKRSDEEKFDNNYQMQDQKQQLPSRMTID